MRFSIVTLVFSLFALTTFEISHPMSETPAADLQVIQD